MFAFGMNSPAGTRAQSRTSAVDPSSMIMQDSIEREFQIQSRNLIRTHSRDLSSGRSISPERASKIRFGASVGASERTNRNSPTAFGRFHRRGQTHILRYRRCGSPPRTTAPTHPHAAAGAGGFVPVIAWHRLLQSLPSRIAVEYYNVNGHRGLLRFRSSAKLVGLAHHRTFQNGSGMARRQT